MKALARGWLQMDSVWSRLGIQLGSTLLDVGFRNAEGLRLFTAGPPKLRKRDAAELVAVSVLIREGWVDNGAVRLHYIESVSDTPLAKTPVVYLPGAYGTAEGFLPEMKALAPRRCVSLSLRGRGKSSSPERGYSFDHNVSDIEAVISKLDLKNFCMMGWSIGVTYSIAYASRNPGLVSGLVLLDYAARHPKWSHGWAERVSSDPSIGKDPDRMRGLEGLERESAEVVLWDSLDRIKCPVLIIGGGQPDAFAQARAYREVSETLAKCRHCCIRGFRAQRLPAKL